MWTSSRLNEKAPKSQVFIHFEVKRGHQHPTTNFFVGIVAPYTIYGNFVIVERFFFDQDKNYLLKEAQSLSKEVLLEKWVLQSVESYIQLHNPLGLVDDFIRRLGHVTHYDTEVIDNIYDLIAAGYRLKYASNQLEFLWDGRSHLAAYREQWTTQYSHWIYGLSLNDAVNRSIIKVCVLKQNGSTTLLEKNLTRIVMDQIGLKWDGRRKSLVRVA